MATVYLATDVRHEREVAVKVLRSDLSASIGAERFLQEIRIAARLGHPHILPLHDSGEAGGLLYYVMPFVRGESLRERLAREGELPVPDAVRIMRDVADALAHAHEHGVVHRDIKPENILLSGRHALVADFGIAKAVSAARTGAPEVRDGTLTSIGQSLGTPAYMAPEQAAADPHVDHRADIYALGVVGYEMVAGEPPFTGASPQQVLASHITETPRPVSARRPVVPPALADALMRCLEKKPADRWQTAGALLAQLEAVATPTGGSTPTDTRPYAAPRTQARRWPLLVGALLVLATAGFGAWRAGLFGGDRAGPAVLLRDRTQLTSIGRVERPAVSPDGRQLAYVARDCDETGCAYAVELQDVGGSATRRVFEDASGIYHIEWSPDRRHLLVTATYAGRWGTHLVSLVGGAPRHVSKGGMIEGGGATFLGSDSLLISDPGLTDSIYWLRVTGLSGLVGDSVRVTGDGMRLASALAIPGTGRLVTVLVDEGDMEVRLMTRDGQVTDRRRMPYGGVRASEDALWVATVEGAPTIVRTTLDPSGARFVGAGDSVYAGRFTDFSVTADGAGIVLDEGAYQFSVWALPLSDALAGRFPDSARVHQGSVPVNHQISPDGMRVLLGREPPAGPGAGGIRYSIRPYDGGAEVPIVADPLLTRAFWEDSTTLALSDEVGGKVRLSLLDVRTNARRQVHQTGDRAVWDFEPLHEGWVWIPEGGSRLRIAEGGTARDVAVPASYEMVIQMSGRPDGTLAIMGWNAGTADTIRVNSIDLETGAATPWLAEPVEDALIRMHADGTLLFGRWESRESVVLFHLSAPGTSRRLGPIPRPVSGFSVSDDLNRATVGSREYFGDVWMMRVVRP